MRAEQRPDGIAHFERYLQLSPDDALGAGLYLAQFDATKVPGRSPDTYMNRLYHTRSAFWDKSTGSARPYRGPMMVAGALARLVGTAEQLDILDAGCGTGLVGDLIHGRARRLDGVDLSPHMLEKAAAKGIYHHLGQGDLVAFMQARAETYDVIASAATLIHFGDLRPVFAAACHAMKAKGLFIFTAFPHGGSGVIVNSYSCYSHSLDYIKDTAAQSGLAVELAEQEVHEYNGEVPVNGWIVALRRVN
jgi:predicted TPR repeat methyltransferase